MQDIREDRITKLERNNTILFKLVGRLKEEITKLRNENDRLRALVDEYQWAMGLGEDEKID